jgi:hypothetical protein
MRIKMYGILHFGKHEGRIPLGTLLSGRYY